MGEACSFGLIRWSIEQLRSLVNSFESMVSEFFTLRFLVICC